MALTLSKRNGAGADADAAMLMRMMVMFMVALPCMCRAVGFNDWTVPIGIMVENEKQQQYFLDASRPQIIAWHRASEFNISGRTFYSRNFAGKHIVLVKSGKGLINGALTAEVLLTSFTAVKWLIQYGKAASPNLNLKIGDFVLLSKTAHAGNWVWANINDSGNRGVASLNFVNYTTHADNPGCVILLNVLNKVWYRTSLVPSPDGSNDDVFWLDTPNSAFTIPDIELAQCSEMGTSHVCLEQQPRVVKDRGGCSADIYVDNADYAQFLTQNLGCDTLDMEAAAVAQVCNGREGVSLLLTVTVAGRAGIETNDKIPCSQIIDRVSYTNAVTAIAQIVEQIPTLTPNVNVGVADPQSQAQAA